jgi:Cytochrome c554 and c-prime
LLFTVSLLARPAFAQFGDEEPNLFVHNAVRCDECHGKMVREWKTSAHARANQSAAFQTLSKVAPEPQTCQRCHAPLMGTKAKTHSASGEGVTCMVCHTLRDVQPSREGAKLSMQLQDVTLYASLCDAQHHYFHKMGCSPLHEKSQFCGGCHLLYQKSVSGAQLPVYTEFEDWNNGPAKTEGADCQACHMPRTLGEVAKGGRTLKHVSHHGLWDVNNALRRAGMSLTFISASDNGDLRDVKIKVHNDGAGHHVPAGSPLRKLALVVEAWDDAGRVVDHQERQWGRLLTDNNDVEVPFFFATKQGKDTRFAPNEAREISVPLRLPQKGALKLALVMRKTDVETAKRLGFERAPDVPLQESSLSITGGKVVVPVVKKGKGKK